MHVYKWVRLLWVALLVVSGTAPASAATEESPAAPGPVTMQVAAGLDGYVDPASPLHVTVELAASALTVGRLELDFGGKVSTAVEVPAGSVKQYDLDGPSPLTRRQLTVRLVGDDGGELSSQTIRLRVAGDEMLVGLAGIEGIETAVRSAVTTPLGRSVTVLNVGPDDAIRMAPLSYVVLGPDALGNATEREVAAILDWVEGGGRLYGAAADVAVVASAGAGTVYAGTSLVVSRVGAGEIGVLSDPSDVAVDEWSKIFRDRPSNAAVVDQARQDASLALVSAASSGQEASVPALPWLLGGIVVFVVLVGPVNFLVLRALRRPEWAWLTIPMLSIAFLAAFWTIGRSQLADFSATHAVVLIDRGIETDGRAGVVVQVESAGEHVMVPPEGWNALPTSSRPFGPGLASGEVEDDRVVFDLDDLGVGTVELEWSEGPLALSAVVTPSTEVPSGQGLDIEVTNSTPWAMWAWGVVVNGVGYNGKGSLEPGATGSVVVRSVLSRVAYDPVISEAVGRRPYDADAPISTYEVVYPLAAFAEQEAPRLRDRDPYVFGFTDDRDISVALDGRSSNAPGTTLMLKRFDLPEGAAASLGGVRPEVLSIVGASSVERYGDEIYAYGADEVYFHYEIPVGAPERGEIDPSFTQLDDVSVYDWTSGDFVPFAWGESFGVADLASPGGEIVIRASRNLTEGEQFFDESITLGRYALRWVTT